jgi:energy-coupling factor transporter ATP-binding protein EcfA2
MIIIDRPRKSLEEDLFKFGPDAVALAESIRTSDERGYAVGVFGPWGSGKSSFMNFMACYLRDKGIPCIDFKAWQYDRYENLLAALVREMVAQKLPRSSGVRLRTLADKVVGSAVVLGAAAASHATSGIISPETIRRVNSIWTNRETPKDAIDGFKEAFCEFSIALGKKGTVPVVVFLDDLDRCLPDNVVAILDALRLLLFDSNCVFVVGVDREVVEHAVCVRYGTTDLPYGRAYLDKIIDVQLRIPTVPGPLFEQGLLVGDEYQNLLPEERQILFSAADGNPRRMLRLLNALAARRSDFSGGKMSQPGRIAEVLTVALRMAFPACYSACLACPDRAAIAFNVLAEQSNNRAGGIGQNGLEAYEHLLKDGHLAAFLRANHTLLNKHFGSGESHQTLACALLTGHAS